MFKQVARVFRINRSRGAASDEFEDSVALLVPGVPEDRSEVRPAKTAKATKTLGPVAAPGKILFLDGVRALLIVVQHSHEYMQDLNLGAGAVDSFFVLSSFLLTMLFMKKSIQLLAHSASYRKWAFTLTDYSSKRFFRVYLLFAVVATALWMLPDEAKRQYYLIEHLEDFDLYKVLTFAFDQRYFVLWTLPPEITYYFFIPLFALVVLRLRSLWWIPFIPAYAWVGYEGWHTDCRRTPQRFSLVRWLRSFSSSWTRLFTLLKWRALRYWGKVSFSVYLVHRFVVYADAMGGQTDYYDRMCSTYGLTLLLATVSYHLVEYPSQLLAQYITRELARRERHTRVSGIENAISCMVWAAKASEDR
ncbi:hypothetical protein PHYPSEUDO_009516 [Phytophthora pseudosyringae]|uniref:Acyltransferase 3 domain-containing protein n=1 Tax=Phytophthora pseudosyringae TaxID=221518 RepID=A0A8T1VCH8_9STRA|nr:hypothetical protein PHYPSEUDO_009516 [Phytophthora pseudosyringae]